MPVPCTAIVPATLSLLQMALGHGDIFCNMFCVAIFCFATRVLLQEYMNTKKRPEMVLQILQQWFGCRNEVCNEGFVTEK